MSDYNFDTNSEVCICNTILRHTKLKKKEKKLLISKILGALHARYFIRGGFTLCSIEDGNVIVSVGMTRQHPDDKYNMLYGKMVSLERATLEIVRSLHGRKMLKKTGYAR